MKVQGFYYGRTQIVAGYKGYDLIFAMKRNGIDLGISSEFIECDASVLVSVLEKMIMELSEGVINIESDTRLSSKTGSLISTEDGIEFDGKPEAVTNTGAPMNSDTMMGFGLDIELTIKMNAHPLVEEYVDILTDTIIVSSESDSVDANKQIDIITDAVVKTPDSDAIDADKQIDIITDAHVISPDSDHMEAESKIEITSETEAATARPSAMETSEESEIFSELDAVVRDSIPMSSSELIDISISTDATANNSAAMVTSENFEIICSLDLSVAYAAALLIESAIRNEHDVNLEGEISNWQSPIFKDGILYIRQAHDVVQTGDIISIDIEEEPEWEYAINEDGVLVITQALDTVQSDDEVSIDIVEEPEWDDMRVENGNVSITQVYEAKQTDNELEVL